ncbi:hypothetical protein D918_07839 [Trichuris suis]|nr:hypothetical protein D918_07839 [Trichuris suis]
MITVGVKSVRKYEYIKLSFGSFHIAYFGFSWLLLSRLDRAAKR